MGWLAADESEPNQASTFAAKSAMLSWYVAGNAQFKRDHARLQWNPETGTDVHSLRPFTPDNIGMARAVRDLKAHLRETGDIRGGSEAFTRGDRSRFLQVLEQAVQDILRN